MSILLALRLRRGAGSDERTSRRNRWSQGVGTMAQSVFPTSYETTGGALAAPAPKTSTGTATACDVCPHAADDHDVISLRFCRATADGTAPRGCICRS
jgi:hypothetical protein